MFIITEIPAVVDYNTVLNVYLWSQESTDNILSIVKQRTGSFGDRPARPTLLEQVLNQKRLVSACWVVVDLLVKTACFQWNCFSRTALCHWTQWTSHPTPPTPSWTAVEGTPLALFSSLTDLWLSKMRFLKQTLSTRNSTVKALRYNY
jgi:hypothetical protein